MRKLSALFLIGLFFSIEGQSQECTHYWDATLTTDPNQAKGYSGDTNNGYGLFSVKVVIGSQGIKKKIWTYGARFKSKNTAQRPQDLVWEGRHWALV